MSLLRSLGSKAASAGGLSRKNFVRFATGIDRLHSVETVTGTGREQDCSPIAFSSIELGLPFVQLDPRAMSVSSTLAYAKLHELRLDPQNPRLGAEKIAHKLDQPELLDAMRDWELEELAESFLESGFFVQEALLVVREKLDGKSCLVVIEGNRRLAAMLYLERAVAGKPVNAKWRELLGRRKAKPELFERIPYLLAEDRKDVRGYLGFRHVSGIKEWDPPEKAAFISKMIEEDHLTYEQVMRRIGSKTETVRRNYIAYRTLQQMKEHDERIDVARVEERFSVLFLSLRTHGTQEYLGIDINASPEKAYHPVPKNRIEALVRFSKWLFGREDKGVVTETIVRDSRQMDRFDKVLANAKAREYLERTDTPDLDVAYRMAGGEEYEVFNELDEAVGHLRGVLGIIHEHRKSNRVEASVEKAARAALELLRGYPELRAKLLDEENEYDRASRKRG